MLVPFKFLAYQNWGVVISDEGLFIFVFFTYVFILMKSVDKVNIIFKRKQSYPQFLVFIKILCIYFTLNGIIINI